jgi:hypothetical protein
MEAEVINIDQPAKRRGGRPKKSPAELRSKRLNIRFTETEYAALCAKAAATNLTPTDYAHAQLIGADFPKSVPKINIDMYRWLRPLAVNINGLAKKANSGEQVSLDEKSLKQVVAELIKLRKALLGA